MRLGLDAMAHLLRNKTKRKVGIQMYTKAVDIASGYSSSCDESSDLAVKFVSLVVLL